MTERTAGRRLPAAWAEVLGELALTAAAVALALLAGAALLALAGYDVRDAYYNLWDGAFGSVYSVADTLVNAMPLLFAGLAVAFAFRGGLFNIGAEGQLYAGALATAVTAAALAEWPSVPLIAAAMLAGALAGGLWGLVPGALKAKTGAHEVITTIMLNYVAILLTTHLVKQYFKAPGPVDQTALIPAHARLPELIAGTRLTWAVVIGVVLVAAVDWLLRRTSFGFDVVLVGSNPGAAVYAGVPVAARTVWTMAVSGAVAGLAGSTMVLGVLYRFIANFSPGYGFTAVAVALVARARPWGVLPAAMLFGALQAGGLTMQLFARIPADLMTAVQGLVILFVAAPGLLYAWRRLPVAAPRAGTAMTMTAETAAEGAAETAAGPDNETARREAGP